MKPKKPKPRVIARMELPSDGSLCAVKILIKTEDGSDLTAQQVLDAVSDELIDFFPVDSAVVEFADDGMDA